MPLVDELHSNSCGKGYNPFSELSKLSIVAELPHDNLALKRECRAYNDVIGRV